VSRHGDLNFIVWQQADWYRKMADKLRDEEEALVICREKVMQRGLPMTVVDAEYQW
jgi:cell fate regulator YaaT (PSP1 superfamily)